MSAHEPVEPVRIECEDALNISAGYVKYQTCRSLCFLGVETKNGIKEIEDLTEQTRSLGTAKDVSLLKAGPAQKIDAARLTKIRSMQCTRVRDLRDTGASYQRIFF